MLPFRPNAREVRLATSDWPPDAGARIFSITVVPIRDASNFDKDLSLLHTGIVKSWAFLATGLLSPGQRFG